ncbi:GntR family transcriptional regulator [Bordetella avium]|uniref:GntR-family transcriptional regulator n=3 Tax=Bordetella avium TaxID=521 RepID=Q2KXH6_BORA1|nr:GntR family transcriptional regulator [Bordetella avium]AZY48205.1 GntR family transcriptional regulator [Bordetella avium]RIQ13551.1 GntR family transcriptional regulator [Bordetella avium]RIQ16495.1 GntR family transcriptional regulator [Bordetella avium]RIQ31253.1 GntR family transcriptional regulator [Bordetella avium]RIQ36898.1 GntR family transcriptional regulator [Bordetella avium]
MAVTHAGDLPVLDRSADVPLHVQVAARLRGYIRARKLGAGTQLPSEAALCERFGVARSVVRQALSALAAEGMIQREAGRPAVVAAASEHRRLVQRSTGLYAQLAQNGVALKTRVLGFGPAEPPGAVADFFGSRRLLLLERLRYVADAPLAYVRTWLPAVPGLQAQDLTDTSLHGVLIQRFDLHPGAGRNQIRAVAADTELAASLQTEVGAPLLMLEGQSADQHGRPLEWFSTWHRAEQLVFDVDVGTGGEVVQPQWQGTAPCAPLLAADALAADHPLDPLARAQALVAELSAELARLRAER